MAHLAAGVAVRRRATCDEARGSLDRIADREIVRSIVASLAPERRDVLLMLHVEQMTTKEIAEDLGIPLGTAATRLRLAQEDFKAAWERYQARMRRETRSRAVLLLFDPLALLTMLRPHGGRTSRPASSGAAPGFRFAMVSIAVGVSFVLGVLFVAPRAPLRALRAHDETRPAIIMAAQRDVPAPGTATTPEAAPAPESAAPLSPGAHAARQPVAATAPSPGARTAILRASRALGAGRFTEALDILAPDHVRRSLAGDDAATRERLLGDACAALRRAGRPDARCAGKP